MVWFRILMIYSLVLVMLPLGSVAAVATSGLQPTQGIIIADTTYVTDIAEAQQKVATKTKRCRTAVLPGLACNAELVVQTPASASGDELPGAMAFFDKVVLPVGVTTTGHRDPPRAC